MPRHSIISEENAMKETYLCYISSYLDLIPSLQSPFWTSDHVPESHVTADVTVAPHPFVSLVHIDRENWHTLHGTPLNIFTACTVADPGEGEQGGGGMASKNQWPPKAVAHISRFLPPPPSKDHFENQITSPVTSTNQKPYLINIIGKFSDSRLPASTKTVD